MARGLAAGGQCLGLHVAGLALADVVAGTVRRMDRARVAVVCGVLAALIGMAGVLTVVRHEDRVVQVAADGVPVVPPTELVPPTPEPEPDVPVPSPSPPAPPPAAVQPAPAEPPPGTLLGTATTPQPATKPTFDPAAYELTAALQPANSQSHGNAGASRVSPTVWRITVIVERLQPNTQYSILVTRPEPSYGTPGPTPCEFVSTRGGWGTCTGEMWVTEGGHPLHAGLGSRTVGGGNVLASGGFA